MKLKGKLIMSAAALAACAATLTSTTYAWYTANTEVSISQISGATANVSDVSSLLVSSCTNYGEVPAWTTYTGSATNITYTSTSITLNPVAYTATEGTLKPFDKAEGATLTLGAESKSNFLEFVLRFKSNADTKVYLSNFSIADPAVALQQAEVYGATSESGITAQGVYGAELTKAMKMYVETGTVALQDNAIPNAFVTKRDGSGTPNVYSLATKATIKDTNIGEGKANAVAYYNEVLGTTLAVPDGYNLGSSFEDVGNGTKELFTIGESGYQEVRFVFYLDGWDSYCFNAMRGQTFKVNMQFSTVQKGSK